MTGRYKKSVIILIGSILFGLFSLTDTNALEKQRLQVKSYPLNEPVNYFNYGGKSYISIGKSKDSILIGYQANKNLNLPDGKVRTVLVQKGVGENDPWIGKYKGGIYSAESENAELIASIEYRNVFIDGKEKTFQMEKKAGEERWQVITADGKIYYENADRQLVLSGHEERRKVILDDKELYLLMRKELKPDSLWECEYNGKVLWSK